MRKDIKEKRELAYLMNKWDDVNLPFSVNEENIPEQVINFFKTQSELIYPAKSYFVAIVYAKCLEKYFGVPFFEALDDKELLFDDKWFKTYNESKEIYDKIIENIGNIWYYNSINKTVDYFKKEFLVWN